jgi:hypothetical protein
LRAIKADSWTVEGEWGDRRQEIVFIGGGPKPLDHAAVTNAFDGCLLTNAEMKKWEKAMRRGGTEAEIKERLEDLFEDGFEGASLFASISLFFAALGTDRGVVLGPLCRLA